MRLEAAIEFIEHDARLDHAAFVLDIKREDAAKMFRAINDEAAVDGLAALRRAAPARSDGHALIPREVEGAPGRIHGLGHDHARRHHLIM